MHAGVQNQGLGFLVFGVVIDRAYFVSLFIKLSALASTVFGSLAALDKKSLAANSGQCGLSPAQENAIAAMVASLNETCSVVFGASVVISG